MKLNRKSFGIQFLVILMCINTSICLFGCKAEENIPQFDTPQNSQDAHKPFEENGSKDPLPSIPEENTTSAPAPDAAIEPAQTNDIPQTDIKNTDPVISTDPVKETSPDETEPSHDVSNTLTSEYIAYYNMSAEEQQAFIASFDSIEAFFQWHTAAKQAYEDSRTPIDGSIPLLP